MSSDSLRVRLSLFAIVGLLLPASAHAAKLTQVSGWNGGVSLPSDVTMSIYVPDKLAASPPVVTVIHYCGGSAQAVFDQAKDIKAAADKYGFIMIMPAQTHSGGCWDVSSKKTQTHDGGGDTHAIAQMVKYTLAQTQYKANANRVYSTGDSSGAMMTQLLMAVYPDIFKAGASFAGVPAGCSNVFDGTGLCGLSAQTAQQWGDRARAMFPGYTGHRPRLQLVHGDMDQTITYKNSAEYIKEWTNVLGLSMDPTLKVDSGLMLGTHQAKRQEWKGSCGYVILDFLTSVGGDHGPSDALFQGNFVLPFLGLDSQAAVDAAVDPEIAQCGSGSGSDGGMPVTDGGVDGTGTDARGGSTGAGGGAGGGTIATGTGGRGAGGMVGTGGSAVGSGGSAAGTGGSGAGTGGSADGTGGNKAGSGGSSSIPNTGGTPGSQSGGAGGSGGSSTASGSGGSGAGSGGSGGSSNGNSQGPGASGCAFVFDASPAGASTIALVLPLIALAFRRKRR
jgi:acetylxylan esterase